MLVAGTPTMPRCVRKSPAESLCGHSGRAAGIYCGGGETAATGLRRRFVKGIAIGIPEGDPPPFSSRGGGLAFPIVCQWFASFPPHQGDA